MMCMLPQTALKTLMVIHTLMRESDVSWLEEASTHHIILLTMHCLACMQKNIATPYAVQLFMLAMGASTGSPHTAWQRRGA